MASKYTTIAPTLSSILTDSQIEAVASRSTTSTMVPVPARPITAEAIELACKFARYLGATEVPLEDVGYINYGPVDIVFRINSRLGYDTGLTQDDIVALKAELDAVKSALSGG